MTDGEKIKLIRKHLVPYMQQFHMKNENNNLSIEMIMGLSLRIEELSLAILNDYILDRPVAKEEKNVSK